MGAKNISQSEALKLLYMRTASHRTSSMIQTAFLGRDSLDLLALGTDQFERVRCLAHSPLSYRTVLCRATAGFILQIHLKRMNEPVPLWAMVIAAACSASTILIVALGFYLQIRSINRVAGKLRAELRSAETRGLIRTQ